MIYLDNSATTRPDERVVQKMTEAVELWGNPSSLHSMGLEAEKLREEARARLYLALGAKKTAGDRIIFTGSGTEANNLAVFGTVFAKEGNKGKKIVTTDSEHPSVLEPFRALERLGFTVAFLKTKNGCIDIEEVKNTVDANTVLISVMLVNNETGAVNGVKQIFDTAKSINPRITTHTDAVQGFLKVPFTPARLNADLVSVSSHKIHGPKGVGALYMSAQNVKTKSTRPILLGGGQEGGFRSGTENMIGICGFGEAARIGRESMESDTAHMRCLKDRLVDKLNGIAKVNMPTGETAPHIISVTAEGVRSETLLHMLSQDGIYVSSGSACSSNSVSHRVSHVLKAFGLDDRAADSTIRISLCRSNTNDDIDRLAEALRARLK